MEGRHQTGQDPDATTGAGVWDCIVPCPPFDQGPRLSQPTLNHTAPPPAGRPDWRHVDDASSGGHDPVLRQYRLPRHIGYPSAVEPSPGHAPRDILSAPSGPWPDLLSHAIQFTQTIQNRTDPATPALLNEIVNKHIPQLNEWLATLPPTTRAPLPAPICERIEATANWAIRISHDLARQLATPSISVTEQLALDTLTAWIGYHGLCLTLKNHAYWKMHLDPLTHSQEAMKQAVIGVMTGPIPTQWLDTLTEDTIERDAPLIQACLSQMAACFPAQIPTTLSASEQALTLLLTLRRQQWPQETHPSCLAWVPSGIISRLSTDIHPTLRVWIVTACHAIESDRVKLFPLIIATFKAQKQHQRYPLEHLYEHPNWDKIVDTCRQEGRLKACKMAFRTQRPATLYDLKWLKGYDAILRHYPSKPSRHTDEIDAWIASDTPFETLEQRPRHDNLTDRLYARFDHHITQATPLAPLAIRQAFLARQWDWLSKWAHPTPPASHGIDTLMTDHPDDAISWLIAKGQSQLAVWQQNGWVSDGLWDQLLNHDACRPIIWQWASQATTDALPRLVLASGRQKQFPENGWNTVISNHPNRYSWPSLLKTSLGTSEANWQQWGEAFPHDVLIYCPLLTVVEGVFKQHMATDPLVIDHTRKYRGVATLTQWMGADPAKWQHWLTHCHRDAITHCQHPDILSTWLQRAIQANQIDHIATILQHQSHLIRDNTLTREAYLTWFGRQANEAITHCNDPVLLGHLLSAAIHQRDTTSIAALLTKNMAPDDIARGWQAWVTVDPTAAIDAGCNTPHMAIIIRHCTACPDMTIDQKRSAFGHIISKSLSDELRELAWKEWLACDSEGAIASSARHPTIIPLLAHQLTASGNETELLRLIRTNGSSPPANQWLPHTLQWVCHSSSMGTRQTVLEWAIQHALEHIEALASATDSDVVLSHILSPLPDATRHALFMGGESRWSDEQLTRIQGAVAPAVYQDWIQNNPHQWARLIQTHPSKTKDCPPQLAGPVWEILRQADTFSNRAFSTLRPLIMKMPISDQPTTIMHCTNQLIRAAGWPGNTSEWNPYLQRHAFLALADDEFRGLTQAVLTARIEKDSTIMNPNILNWVGEHHPDHLSMIEDASWYHTEQVKTLIETLGAQHRHITTWWDRAVTRWHRYPEKSREWVPLYWAIHPTLGDNWLSSLMGAPKSVLNLLTPPVCQTLWNLPALLSNPQTLNPLLLQWNDNPVVAEKMLTALIETLKTDVKSMTDATMSAQRQALITHCLSQLEDKTSEAEQTAYNQVAALKQAETFQFTIPSDPSHRMNAEMLACMVGNSVFDDHCTDPTPSPVTLGAWLHDLISSFDQPNMHPSFQLKTKAPRQTIQWLQEAAQLAQSPDTITHQTQWEQLLTMPPHTTRLISIGSLIPSQSAQPRPAYTALVAHRSDTTWTLYHLDPQAPPLIQHAQHTPIQHNGKALATITRSISWTGREIKEQLPSNAPNWWCTLLQTHTHPHPLSNEVFYHAIWSQVPGTTLPPAPNGYQSLGRGHLSSAFQLFGAMAWLATQLNGESRADHDRLMCLIFLGAAEDVAAPDNAHEWRHNPELNAMTAELKHELTSRCLKYLQHNQKDGFSSTLMTHTIRLAKAIDTQTPPPTKVAMGCPFNVPENPGIMTLFFPYVPIPNASLVIEELPTYRHVAYATLAELKQTIDTIGYSQLDPATQHRVLEAVFHHVKAGLPVLSPSASQTERNTLMAQLLGMATFLSHVVDTQRPLMIPSYSMWHPVSWHQLGLCFLTLSQTAWQVVANAPETRSVFDNTRLFEWDEMQWVYQVTDPDWVTVAKKCQTHPTRHGTHPSLFNSTAQFVSRINQHTITPGHENYCRMDHGIYTAMKTKGINDDMIFKQSFKQTQIIMPWLRDMISIVMYRFNFLIPNPPAISTLPDLTRLITERAPSDSAAIVTTHANPPRRLPDMPTSLYLHLNMAHNTQALTHHNGFTWASRMAALLASRTLQLEQLSHRLAITAAMRDWLASHPTMGAEANALANQLACQATVLTQKGPLSSAGLAWIASTLCQLSRHPRATQHIKDMAPSHRQTIRQTLLDWTTHPDHLQRTGIVATHWILTYQFDPQPSDPAHWFCGLLRWRQALSQEKPLYCPLDDSNTSMSEEHTEPTDLANRRQAVIHTCQRIIWQGLAHVNPMAPEHLSGALANRNITLPPHTIWQATAAHPYLWGTTDANGRWHVDTSTGMVYRNGVSIDRLPTAILHHPDYQAIQPSTPHDWQLIDGWFCGQPQGDPSALRYQLALVPHGVTCTHTREHLTLDGDSIPIATGHDQDIAVINGWLHPFKCQWRRYQDPGSPTAWLVEYNPPTNRLPLILAYETETNQIQHVTQWLPYGHTWIQRTIMARYEHRFLGTELLSRRGQDVGYFRDIMMPTTHQLVIREETKGVFIPSWIGACQLPGWLHDPNGTIWQTDDQLHFQSNQLRIQSIRPDHDRLAQHVLIRHQDGIVLPLHDAAHTHFGRQPMSHFEPHNHTLLLETETDWQLRFLRLGIKLIKPKYPLDTPAYCPELGNAPLIQTDHPPIWPGFDSYLCLGDPSTLPTSTIELDKVPFKVIVATRPLTDLTKSYTDCKTILYRDSHPPSPPYVVGHFNPVSRRFDSDSIIGRLVLAHLFYLSATLTPCHYTQLNGYEMAALLLAACQPSEPFSELETDRLRDMLTYHNPHRNACAIRLKIVALLNQSHAMKGLTSTPNKPSIPSHEDISRYTKSRSRIPVLCQLSHTEWDRIPAPPAAKPHLEPYRLTQALTAFIAKPADTVAIWKTKSQSLVLGGSTHPLTDPNGPRYQPLDAVPIHHVWLSWLHEIQTSTRPRDDLRTGLWASGCRLTTASDTTMWAICMALTHCSDWSDLDPFQELIQQNRSVCHAVKYPNIATTFDFLSPQDQKMVTDALNHTVVAPVCHGQRAIHRPSAPLDQHPLDTVKQWYQRLSPSHQDKVKTNWDNMITRGYQATQMWKLLNTVCDMAIKHVQSLQRPPAFTPASIDVLPAINLLVPTSLSTAPINQSLLSPDQYTTPIQTALVKVAESIDAPPDPSASIATLAKAIQTHCLAVLPALLDGATATTQHHTAPFPLAEMKPVPTHQVLVTEWCARLREQWSQLTQIQPPPLPPLPQLANAFNEIQQTWKEHEESLVSVLEAVLCDSVNNPQGWRFQMKQTHGSHPFMLQQVYTGLLNPDALGMINPFIPSDAHHTVIIPMIRVLVGIQTLLQHTNRCCQAIKRLAHLRDQGTPHDLLLQTAHTTLYDLLSTQPSPSDDDHALFELYNNMRIRPIQRDMIRWLLPPQKVSNQMSMDDEKSVVTQMNMGEGKSSVILMVMLLQLITHKKKPLVVVPASLLNDVTQLIKTRLTPLTGVHVLRLPITRENLGQLPEHTQQEIKRQLANHDQVPLVLLMTPEETLGLRLGLEEAILTHNDALRAFLTVIHHHSDHLIIDEVDETLNLTKELNFTWGNRTPIENSEARVVVPLTLFHQLAITDGGIRHILSPETVDRVLSEQFKVTLPTPWDPNTLQPIQGLSSQIADAIWRWRNPQLFQHVVSLRPQVEYGLCIDNPYDAHLAIPYEGKDTPLIEAMFEHTDVRIGLSILAYYHQGLVFSQWMALIRLAISRPYDAHTWWAQWIEGTDCPIQRWDSLNVSDINQAKTLHALLGRRPVVIQSYLSHIALAHITEFENKLSADGTTLTYPSRTTRILGFSGTTTTALPHTVAFKPLPALAQTDALNLRLFADPTVVTLREQPVPSDSMALIEAFIRECNHDPLVSCILDAGALITGQSNQEVATALSRGIRRPAFHGVVFFGDKGEVLLMRPDSDLAVPFCDTDCTPDQIITYVNDIRTRGTDRVFPALGRGLLTVGERLANDRLTQAAMRLRQLGRGQTVTMWVSDRIKAEIEQWSEQSPLRPVDVYGWSMWQSACRDGDADVLKAIRYEAAQTKSWVTDPTLPPNPDSLLSSKQTPSTGTHGGRLRLHQQSRTHIQVQQQVLDTNTLQTRGHQPRQEQGWKYEELTKKEWDKYIKVTPATSMGWPPAFKQVLWSPNAREASQVSKGNTRPLIRPIQEYGLCRRFVNGKEEPCVLILTGNEARGIQHAFEGKASPIQLLQWHNPGGVPSDAHSERRSLADHQRLWVLLSIMNGECGIHTDAAMTWLKTDTLSAEAHWHTIVRDILLPMTPTERTAFQAKVEQTQAALFKQGFTNSPLHRQIQLTT